MTYVRHSRLLARHSEISTASLSQEQISIDHVLTSFQRELGNVATLAAIGAGTLSYRLSKLGILSLGSHPSLHFLAPLGGLGVEVSAFRGVQSLFSSENRKIFGRDWFSSLIDFGCLKLFSPLAHRNLLLGHFTQANAMVLGQEFSSRLGLLETPKGTYLERLAHAEAMNMALGASMGLWRHLSPRLSQIERSIENRIQSHSKSAHPVFNSLSRQGLLPTFASQDRISQAGSDAIALRLKQIAHPRFKRVRDEIKIPNPETVPPNQRIGILTSGGDGPGENAILEALVTGILRTYGDRGWNTVGIFDGFRGLLEPEGRLIPLGLGEVRGEAAIRRVHDAIQSQSLRHLPRFRGISELGGNFLRSSRTNPVNNDPFASRVKATMHKHQMDALVVIGGNGSMGASRDLAKQGVRVVFIPQSIDNDVPGTDISLGFPSAVAEGVRNVRLLNNTGQSCERWFIVEVMGQHSGALALAIAREAKTEGVFIGEHPRPLSDISSLIEFHRKRGRNHGVILLSEGVKFLNEQGQPLVIPQETDAQGRLLIRSGQIAQWVSDQVGRNWTRPESFAYLLRGANPTDSEIALSRQLALGAIHLLADGKTSHSVGLRWEGSYWRRDYQTLNPEGNIPQTWKISAREYQHVMEELGIIFH